MTYSQNNIDFHYTNDSKQATIVINKKWNEKKFKNFSYFGLFSGEMKEFIINNFDKTLLNMIENDPNLYKILTTKNDDQDQIINNNNLISSMFSNVCKDLNEKLFKEMNNKMNSYECLTLGATALVCLSTPNEIYLINISDSKAILVNNNNNKLQLETKQFSLLDSKEKIEIFNAKIDDNNKMYIESLDNNYYKFDLTSTRAFGHYLFNIDHPHGFKFNNIKFKSINTIVKCEPDIQIIERNNNSYLLLATSEFWNCMTNKDVIDYIKETNETDLNILCNNLIHEAKKRVKEISNETNNMSLVLVTFDDSSTKNNNNHLNQLTSSDTLPDIKRNLKIYSDDQETRGDNQLKFEVECLKDEIKTKNNKLKEKDLQITNLKHQINQLKLEKNDFSNQSSVSVFLESNDDETDQEIDDDLDEYEYDLNENAKLCNRILMLKIQVACLEDDIETKNNKLEENKHEIDDLKQQIDKLKEKLIEKHAKLDDTNENKHFESKHQLESINDIKKIIKLEIKIDIKK